MKILHVIATQFPVRGYGGTERVAYWLGKAQAELGHDVRYLCKPGSLVPFAKVLELPEEYPDLNPYIPTDTEIVHLYGTPRFRINFPYLVTIEGNGQAGETFDRNTVFVSRNHALRHGWKDFVYNGIDIDEYPLEAAKENYALFLAKASWNVKNLKGAIRIAQAAKLPLYVAGGRAWFWQRGVKSFGMVDGAEKLRLLQKSQALLFPIIWQEPFGIAVVEAMACGTPVVATPRGSLPEIIDAKSGILADSHDALRAALVQTRSFDPEGCRARVLEKFTHLHMANSYLEYYKRILRHGFVAEGMPQAPLGVDPEAKQLYAGY